MAKISLQPPRIVIRRGSYDNPQTFKEILDFGRIVKDAFRTIADAINTLFDGDLASSGGVTGSRPSSPRLYQQYFDTTIGKPIWWDGSNWVDATGATV